MQAMLYIVRPNNMEVMIKGEQIFTENVLNENKK